ncbi:DUF4160 domain-containing protein [Pelagibacterium sediminicola]|uniref:DUF4160 domain-containing protein n=1 Tax=Pelagibacterium sediminicola TaxID=2248761 RepID=UPI000E313D03|nr:DUF4160 domain-containing protein [Pelagibacterium sediminicola]
MPTISRFFGIDIRMYARDHLPPTARRLVHEWAYLHRAELADNWELAQKDEPLLRIEGLDVD